MTEPEELKSKMREALDEKQAHEQEPDHPVEEGVEHDTSENSRGVDGPIDNPGQTPKHTHGTI